MKLFQFVTSNSDTMRKLDFNMWHSVGPMKIQNIEVSFVVIFENLYVHIFYYGDVCAYLAFFVHYID